MTDEVIGSGSAQQGQVQTSSEPVAPVSTPTQSENMISQSRVNEIVQQRTREASEKAYQRGLTESQQKAQQQAQPASTMGGMTQMTDEQQRAVMRQEVDRMLNERASDYKRQQTQENINQMAQNYLGKIDAAKEKYPDLANRREEIGEFAELIPFINEIEDAAGVTDHLLNNGHNVASLLFLAEKSPAFVRRELKKLAESIKQNESAKDWPHINAPLNSVTPSINTMDSGSSSIEALKNTDFLRG